MESKAFYKREIKRFRVEETFSGVVATEDLRQAWIAFVVTVALLVTGSLWLIQSNDQASPTGISILAGIIILILWAAWPATNLRMVFDERDDSCILQKRFYAFVYRTRYLTMQHASISRRYTQNIQSGSGESKGSDVFGCLLFFLGPIGLVLGGLQMLSNRKDTPTHSLHLMHVDQATGVETILAKIDSNSALTALSDGLKSSVCGKWFNNLP